MVTEQTKFMQGKQLFLRAPELADVELLYQWENNTSLWEVSNTITPFSHFAIEQFVLNAGTDIFASRQLRLIICLKNEDETPIGAIDLFDFDPHHSRAGIGIVIVPEHRNLGYATEAIEILTDYCFNVLNLHQVYCNITEDNLQSIQLFEGVGFEKAGKKRAWIKSGNNWKDEYVFQKINKTFA